jgi:regulator of protease activity HflC (stomatin/prohibitin superfamily)
MEFILIPIIAIVLLAGIKIINQYERGVVRPLYRSS